MPRPRKELNTKGIKDLKKEVAEFNINGPELKDFEKGKITKNPTFIELYLRELNVNGHIKIHIPDNQFKDLKERNRVYRSCVHSVFTKYVWSHSKRVEKSTGGLVVKRFITRIVDEGVYIIRVK